ncbi:uncharacterized protein LOC129297468 [Prosopis cineraria]|uniref:uncharacterized protein LOC129297468 n=1 Tax=Prosopis cineraria TaxID=364024 RepID=UPI00240EEF00|nr:uncharacterized protein LOC129297468 [Prosopis cineraria]
MAGIDKAIKKKKLTAKFMGSYEIIERIRPVPCRVALPPQIAGIHNVFYMSQLKKYNPTLSYVIQPKEVKFNENLTFRSEPEWIEDVKDKQLCNKAIQLVKVIWKGTTPDDATWEIEDNLEGIIHIYLHRSKSA